MAKKAKTKPTAKKKPVAKKKPATKKKPTVKKTHTPNYDKVELPKIMVEGKEAELTIAEKMTLHQFIKTHGKDSIQVRNYIEIIANRRREKKEDNVNHPKHYTDGSIEVIDYIEDKKLNFHLGNTVKYISRAGKKDPSKYIEDLEKAQWYLNREIENAKKRKSESMKKIIPAAVAIAGIGLLSAFLASKMKNGKKSASKKQTKPATKKSSKKK